MALGEQFLSRPITYTPTGARGRRVFLQLWDDRWLASLPQIGERWPPDANNHTHPGMAEGLWLHEIVPTPYGGSGDKGSSSDVATHVKLEYIYESSKPLTSDPAGWLISSNSTTQAVQVGKDRSFAENTAHKVDSGQPIYIAMTEVVIRGLEYLGLSEPDQHLVASPTKAAEGRLGLVCSETFIGTAAPGQVLLQGEDTGEPFMRRTCRPAEAQPIAWYREFSRRFLLKHVRYTVAPNTMKVAGHNELWDSQAQSWGTVEPQLYAEVPFSGPGDDVVFPF